MKTVFIVLLAEVYLGTVATTYIERGNVFFFKSSLLILKRHGMAYIEIYDVLLCICVEENLHIQPQKQPPEVFCKKRCS